MSIIEVQSLTKKYARAIAVNGVSFNVNEGEIYGLLGPNGAGKTTTLECIEGLRKYNSGIISIAGCDPQRQKRLIRDKVGIQLQSSSLPSNMLVKEAMGLFCEWHHTEFRVDLMKQFGIEEFSKKQYHQLSTGQKRRLHLALALVHNPIVVVLDEPTAGLDVEGRKQLHDEIRQLKKQNVSMLMATHDMAETEELCDRISIIMKGQVVITGTPTEVSSLSKQGNKVAVCTSNNAVLKTFSFHNSTFLGEKDKYLIWKSANTADIMEPIMLKAKELGINILDIRIDRPTLEESFLEIVSKEE